MLLRNVTVSDFQEIDNLYKQYGFTLDFKNLEDIILVESNGKLIAIGTMVKLLEVAFLTTRESSKKERIIALEKLTSIADLRAKRLGFKQYHAFGTTEAISRFLKKRLGFAKVAGEALIRWVS